MNGTNSASPLFGEETHVEISIAEGTLSAHLVVVAWFTCFTVQDAKSLGRGCRPVSAERRALR